jgi:hypothetical protein
MCGSPPAYIWMAKQGTFGHSVVHGPSITIQASLSVTRVSSNQSGHITSKLQKNMGIKYEVDYVRLVYASI